MGESELVPNRYLAEQLDGAALHSTRRFLDKADLPSDTIWLTAGQTGDWNKAPVPPEHQTQQHLPDGYARLTTRVKAAPTQDIQEFTGVDVTDHWVPRLGWGNWQTLATPPAGLNIPYPDRPSQANTDHYRRGGSAVLACPVAARWDGCPNTSYQSGVLGAFYRTHRIQPGDIYRVRLDP